MMRRALLALAALCAFVSCALAVPPSELPVLLGAPGWVLPGASLDMDFANGRYYGMTPSRLTTARASVESEVCNGTLYSFAVNQPAITPGCGLWVWESRTNSITNNTMVGAGVGTPPTGWATPTVNGISASVTSVFTQNGITWTTLSITGTATATGSSTNLINFTSPVTLPGAYGQTHSISAYLSGTGTIPPVSLDINERNGGGSLGSNASIVSVTSSPQLFSFSTTLSRAATTLINPRLLFSTVNTNVYSGTITIGLPQLELNPNLPATAASAVKAADGTGGAISASGVYTVTGGTCTTPPTLNVTWDAGGLMTVNSVANAGSCSVLPPSPATLAYASGAATGWTGATVTLTPTDNSAKAFATGPILTSAAAATRAANNIIATTLPCPAPSMLAVATPSAPNSFVVNQYLLHISDGASTNRGLILKSNSSGIPQMNFITGGNAAAAAQGSWGPGISAKLAAEVRGTLAYFSLNGAAPSTAAQVNGPISIGLTKLTLGHGNGGVNPFNGVLSRAALACNGASVLRD